MTILHDYYESWTFCRLSQIALYILLFYRNPSFETNLNYVDPFSRLRIAVNFVPVQKECILTHILYPFAHQMHGWVYLPPSFSFRVLYWSRFKTWYSFFCSEVMIEFNQTTTINIPTEILCVLLWIFPDVGMIMMQTGMVKQGVNYQRYLDGRPKYHTFCLALNRCPF